MPTPFAYTGSTSTGIAASIEAGVRSGELAPGDQLPAVRTLAAQLTVSPGTVAAAYRMLRERGVVETGGRRGTQVRAAPALAGRSTLRLPVPAGARDVSTGSPDPQLLPLLTGHLHAIPAQPVLYDEGALVIDPLARLARERLAADGVAAPGLTVASGALDAIERVLAAHLRPGDQVAVEDPGWANLLDLIASMGLTVEPVRVDEDGPVPESVAAAFRRGVRGLVITSRAQNPTGASMSAARAAELRTLIAQYSAAVVLEDDHIGELASTGFHPVADAAANWAVVRSVSKPYGPDLRCSILAGDEQTISRVEGRYGLAARWVSTVLQSLVVSLWSDPEVAALVRRARTSYDQRRASLVEALAAKGIAAYGKSGLNVWIPVPDETSVCARLLDAGWVVAPGRMYRIASEPGVRITISTLDTADMPGLADSVAAALRPRARSYAV
ncbi:aminotransferase class I/II-fold pyridoxal phosphate-dependent enzyme [Fodinicola acaciae]|uniref:aminotransferase class I/II-fold pyridoxal phosphate-dependent enzyme n=1 Tax=Fodinicola acaciae TaxID=2681555 RepID=UPI0013D143E4|nr:aminotransferase class I/II-fold pyridoxal phosphate-dependent enzyme [Fodinicola acaciae]